MENAIKKAIEGEYKAALIKNMGEKKALSLFCHDTFLLDPLFWQALGKACGWSFIGTSDIPQSIPPQWVNEWHRFIDHLAEGKDADSFLNELLK